MQVASTITRVSLVALVIGASGCTSVYWDKEWQYSGTRKGIPESQRLRVTSEPTATVKVNDEIKGETPLNVTLPYSKSVVTAVKNQYEKSFDGSIKVLNTQRDTEEIVQAAPYVFTFQAAGHHDLVMPVVIPTSSGTLHVRLSEAGIINDIECKLRIEARKEYFSAIERIIREHAVQSKFTTVEEEPVQLEGQNIYRQTFNLIVKDSIQFDALVNALLDEAKENHFVFDILDAKTEATFSTNVMDTGIEHIVRGRVRRGSVLFFIQHGNANRIAGVDEDGRFAFRVRLSEGERYVFLVSKYKDILRVYKKVDVFSQQETEMTEDAFAKQMGITVEALRKMID